MPRYHLVVSPLLTLSLASAFLSFIPNNKVWVSLLLLWVSSAYWQCVEINKYPLAAPWRAQITCFLYSYYRYLLRL